MHVHLAMPGGRDVLPLYIANGVTGVRDMAGDWPTLTAWRGDIARGTVIGPRIVASGPYLEGGDQPIPHLLVKSPADAAPAVDSLIRLGVDFIKVHGQLTRESYFAIARAARARRHSVRRPRVAGRSGAADASDSGQASIEHILAIPNRVHRRPRSSSLAPRFPVQAALGRCEHRRPGAARSRSSAATGRAWFPRSSRSSRSRGGRSVTCPGDSVQRYLPDSTAHATWPASSPWWTACRLTRTSWASQLFDKRVAMAGALLRAGVVVMAGTDAPLRNSPPGFGLHEELLYAGARGALAVRSRSSAATLEPARFLGMARLAGHHRGRESCRPGAA